MCKQREKTPDVIFSLFLQTTMPGLVDLAFLSLELMSEHDEQSAYFAVLKLNERRYPWLRFAHAIPNAAKRSPQLAARMLKEGLKAGVCDIFLPFPMRLWHGAYIEMKFGKNKLTPEQAEFSGFIMAQNYAFKTAYSCDEALEFTEQYLEITLTK